MMMAGFALLVASALGASSSPTGKVVKMLEDLKTEAQTEQTAETESFKKYSAWCTTSKDERTQAITDGEDKEAKGVSLIEEKTAEVAEFQGTLKEQSGTVERLENERLASKRQCSEDQSTYESTEADLDSAVQGLKAAIGKLQTAAGTKASLLQLNSELQQSLNLAEAMGFLKEPKHEAMVAFLQGGKPAWLEEEGEQYNQTDYSFQSGGIVQTLKDLETQFTAEHDSLKVNWQTTSAACASTQASKKTASEETGDALTRTKGLYSTTQGDLAKGKAALQAARKSLKEDRAFLNDLNSNCGARSGDFAQRSKNRAGEIEAIQAALKVMKGQVEDLAAAVAESSLLSAGTDVSVQLPSFGSFIQQQKAHNDAKQHAVTKMNSAEAEMNAAALAQASTFLSKAGSDLNSLRLSGLALRMQQTAASGKEPLQFVKEMTEKMLNDLQTAATAATTKKGLCETQKMKASKERFRRSRESMSLDKKLKALDITRQELIETIDLQSSSISKMEGELGAVIKLRANESSLNLATIRDAKKGSDAVADAIGALQNFYNKAARRANMYDEAAAFLQQGSHAAKEDPSAGFEGSYAGKQDKALGVVTLLETIRDDFKTTAKETQEEEDDAADKFTKLKSESKVSISGKRTSMTMNKEDLESTINELSAGKESLTNTVGLLDSALTTLEDLNKECAASELTYEQLKASRENDINMLKQAMCILDTQHVDPSCSASTTAAR